MADARAAGLNLLRQHALIAGEATISTRTLAVDDPATGEVIGVLNMVFVKSTKESVLSDPSGISYAIPVEYLHKLLAQLR